jgi:cytosine/adenosine deaminase-related metal-dependent hydrolase
VALDPIHTIRAAKRLHLKDGVFLSLAPPGVFEGHLRAVHGKVAWLGPASTVERGEEVLECWRQLVMPGLSIAEVDPLETALRVVPEGAAPAAREKLASLGEEDHKTLAIQTFVECASLGVLAPILDLRGASVARARGTAAAVLEVGLRAVLEWDGDANDFAALAAEIGATDSIRCIRPIEKPCASILGIARGAAVDPAAILSTRGGPPDVLALVRALERRERGLGFRCLANTYAIADAAFGSRFGALARGSFFDVVFLDYEPPARLDANNIETFLTAALGPWCIEASAVGTHPVMKRHEVITTNREEVARRVAEIVGGL